MTVKVVTSNFKENIFLFSLKLNDGYDLFQIFYGYSNIFCCHSVAQSCLTLRDPMNCSTLGFPVLHCLLEFTQTHVHWVGDAIQTCYPLLSPFPPACNLSQYRGLFLMGGLFLSGGQSFGASASAWVFQMNIQVWFLYKWLLWSPCRPRNSQESSPTLQFESTNSLVLSLLYDPTLTSIHDYWRNHSFDYMDLCQQRNVSGF